MVMGLKAGLTLLSPSYISRAVLHEQAVAYFTPIAAAAVLEPAFDSVSSEYPGKTAC